jgi:uncharacterized protein (DUF2147 family)
LVAVLLFVAASSNAIAQDASQVMGAWQREDGIARVKVAPCGAPNNPVICMTNTYIRPDVSDEKVGERLEFNLDGVSNAALTGTAFEPKTGRRFSTAVTVAGDRMTTKGCILGGVICKSTEWTRLR